MIVSQSSAPTAHWSSSFSLFFLASPLPHVGPPPGGLSCSVKPCHTPSRDLQKKRLLLFAAPKSLAGRRRVSTFCLPLFPAFSRQWPPIPAPSPPGVFFRESSSSNKKSPICKTNPIFHLGTTLLPFYFSMGCCHSYYLRAE
jgi:hypothetical protein